MAKTDINMQNINVQYPVAIICAFLWIGFVCAISFMEAWIKFQAPGISVPLGLGIGRLVFSALNKVEWVLAIVVLIEYFTTRKISPSKIHLLYFIALAILLVQTFYMLPALDVRAQKWIDGLEHSRSTLHFYYIAVETIKVISLSIFGIALFKNKNK